MSSELPAKILAIVQSQPDQTTIEIATQAGVGPALVRRHLYKLMGQQKIKRSGNQRVYRWKPVE